MALGSSYRAMTNVFRPVGTTLELQSQSTNILSMQERKNRKMAANTNMARRVVMCAALAIVSLGHVWAQDAGSNGQNAPDNTKTNAHQRANSDPTADQQKESTSDRAISQQIRKAIVKDKSLSSYAHNIKIVTQNGQATLAWPVHSEEEKKALEDAAAGLAGAGNVRNQLQVAPKQ